MRHYTTAPAAEDIVSLAEQALEAIPMPLRRHVSGVAFNIDEFADAETLQELGVESEWDLSGLYRGTPLHQRNNADVVRAPDMIFLYRQPILLEWIETGEDLAHLVRSVMIHEIAHHFGFSDDEIEALEADAQ